MNFPKPPAWTEQAICAQVDPELFFPEIGGTTLPAIKVCSTCPVKAECLAYAIENHDREGIWGGVAPHARRGMAA